MTCCGLMVILCHPDLRKIAFGYFALVVVGPFVILRKVCGYVCLYITKSKQNLYLLPKLVEKRSPQNERNNVSSFSNVLKRVN